ncbi:thymidylate kinase [Gordonia effusa NBRC 100432]|uniref:Thymidylate kinase n=1 Tax=Gordonia effusa NBRC 100432 TaxID=1077974 RepID=H0QUL3_9ACTN|nr:dTMP kinase [Gordonia effusa]GAB16514.1 thymidylate kinase [Gordonia effusa NBRC 100432]
MGKLIAVEGLDGAGKNTLVTSLVTGWRARGMSVATLAFPRYGAAVTADIAAEALHGRHGDLASSAYAMAMLFALDRADAAGQIRADIDSHDVVILDRYVASNAAYSAARLGEPISGPAATWVADLEFGRFALPVPNHQVFLGVPTSVAAERARTRAASDATRARDAYERDGDLQTRVDAAYRDLAAAQWFSPWSVTTGEADDPAIEELTAI